MLSFSILWKIKLPQKQGSWQHVPSSWLQFVWFVDWQTEESPPMPLSILPLVGACDWDAVLWLLFKEVKGSSCQSKKKNYSRDFDQLILFLALMGFEALTSFIPPKIRACFLVSSWWTCLLSSQFTMLDRKGFRSVARYNRVPILLNMMARERGRIPLSVPFPASQAQRSNSQNEGPLLSRGHLEHCTPSAAYLGLCKSFLN